MVLAVTLPRLGEDLLLRLQLRRQRQAVDRAAAGLQRIDLAAQGDHVRVVLVVGGELLVVFGRERGQLPLIRAGVARLHELLLQKDLVLAQGAGLLPDIVQIALRAVHQIQVQVRQLRQLAEVLRLELRQARFQLRDLGAVLVRLGVVERTRRPGAHLQVGAAGEQEGIRQPRRDLLRLLGVAAAIRDGEGRDDLALSPRVRIEDGDPYGLDIRLSDHILYGVLALLARRRE